MSPFWTTFVAVVGSIATLLAGVGGFKVFTRGRRTTFTANIWKRLEAVENELKQERIDRQKETASLRAENTAVRAALQQFRYRDGAWMEMWHNGNVERVAAGLPSMQLPDALRKWPEEIIAVANSGA